MPTCRDIATDALQLIGAYGGGEAPSAEDADAAQIALQSLYDGWVNSGMFGRAKDVYAAADYTANEGERVTPAAGVTVTLPVTLRGSDGVLRAPRDLSMIQVAGTAFVTSVYDLNAWVSLTSLTPDSVAPLSQRSRRGLASCLAYLIAGDFNMPMTPSITRAAAQFRMAISIKMGSTQDPTPVEYM